MIDHDTELRRLVARERAAALAEDWRRAARPRDLHTPQLGPGGQRANSRLALLLRRHHRRHAYRVAAHRG